jgi:hypothetical protein
MEVWRAALHERHDGISSDTWRARFGPTWRPKTAYSFVIRILAAKQNIFYTDPATTLIKGVLSLGLWIHG